jgi:hypothetical protein
MISCQLISPAVFTRRFCLSSPSTSESSGCLNLAGFPHTYTMIAIEQLLEIVGSTQSPAKRTRNAAIALNCRIISGSFPPDHQRSSEAGPIITASTAVEGLQRVLTGCQKKMVLTSCWLPPTSRRCERSYSRMYWIQRRPLGRPTRRCRYTLSDHLIYSSFAN